MSNKYSFDEFIEETPQSIRDLDAKLKKFYLDHNKFDEMLQFKFSINNLKFRKVNKSDPWYEDLNDPEKSGHKMKKLRKLQKLVSKYKR